MDEKELRGLALAAKGSIRQLARLTRARKDVFLRALADRLERGRDELLAANQNDVAAGTAAGLSPALLDRLTLTAARITSLAGAVREVAALPDPVGSILGMTRRPNGLQVGRMRVPLGVIAIIYESRPNVTVDAAILCFKAGNACLLRGGREAVHTNVALGRLMQAELTAQSLPPAAITVLPSTDRADVEKLLAFDGELDLVIPRGGESLIRRVRAVSRVPVIAHLHGNCHVYVDDGADLKMAGDVCFNAKVQRPGVCNAMETLLVHSRVAGEFLPAMVARYAAAGVELRGCPRTVALGAGRVTPAVEADWGTEYLDLILAVRVVDSLDEAIDHIERYGSHHTDSIVTRDYARAQRFLAEVDSATVLVNASTRFSDGGEFGLGAEIGISTQKLHCRGPMGLEDLTCAKWIVLGDGQLRG